MTTNTDQFVRLTYDILQLDGLTMTEKVVLAHFRSYPTWFRPESRKKIAAKLKISTHQLRQALYKLRKHGHDVGIKNVYSGDAAHSGDASVEEELHSGDADVSKKLHSGDAELHSGDVFHRPTRVLLDTSRQYKNPEELIRSSGEDVAEKSCKGPDGPSIAKNSSTAENPKETSASLEDSEEDTISIQDSVASVQDSIPDETTESQDALVSCQVPGGTNTAVQAALEDDRVLTGNLHLIAPDVAGKTYAEIEAAFANYFG
jgi:hypothetical protein